MRLINLTLFVVTIVSQSVTETIQQSELDVGPNGTEVGTCSTLRLLNLVPYPDNRTFAGWDRGFELIPAGHLAARHINSDPDVLPGYKLEVTDLPSEACGISLITEGLLEFFADVVSPTDTCAFGVVGLFCSTVTNTIAPIASHPKFGHVVLTASTSPIHRDTTALPHTFHTIASSSVFNEAVIALMDEFQWKRIHIVHDSLGFYFVSTIIDFVKQIRSNVDKTITSRIPIQPLQSFISDVFTIFNNEGARIGYFSITEDESAVIFCEAYRRKFLWPGYVYILPERSLIQILSIPVSCSKEEMLLAVEGTFLLQYRLFDPLRTKLVSGLTYQQYHDEYLQELRNFARQTNMDLEDNIYANSLYDQVWAFALAANKSVDRAVFFNSTLAPGNIEKTVRNRAVLAEQLRSVEFSGASGFIRFGEGQEVRTLVDIYQVKNGEQVLIGLYDSYNRSVRFFDTFNRDLVPKDTFDVIYKLVPTWVGLLVFSCDILVFVLILFITISIVVWRKRPEIKSASFPLSLIMLLGCYGLCISVLLQTVRVIFIVTAPSIFTVLCNLELWLFINGINVILVALSVRLLRIFYVFRSYHSTGKYWSDRYLILYIALICSVLFAVLLIWTAVDPLHLVQERSYISSANPPHYLLRNNCSSNSLGIWVSLSLCLIGLVVLLVIFLAVQTRHIKRKHFKDTKKVNAFIFSTCICYAVFLPLWLILSSAGYNTGSYVSKCIAKLLGVTLCAVLLFLPKIIPTFHRKWKPKPEQVEEKVLNKYTYSSSSVTI